MANEDSIERSSRRLRGEEPTNLEHSNNQLLSRELQGLTRRGGRGGQLYDEENGWDYFPATIGDLSPTQRYEQNKDVFKHIDEIQDTNHDYDNETSVQEDSTYQMINMKHLRHLINETMTCRCSVGRASL